MHSAKILIVDDEDTVCRTFSKFLASKGYATAIAPNALEAIRTCRNSNIDAVISDIHMPEMDGGELLRELHQDSPKLPVILMSGATDLRSALGYLKEDAFDFLAKPVEPNDLLRTLKRALTPPETEAETPPETRNLGSIKHETFAEPHNCSIISYYQALDASSENTLVQPLRRLLREGVLRKTCILRLADTGYINNIGLNQLLEIQRMLQQDGHNLILVEIPEAVRRYLNLLGYLDFFSTAGSAQEALVSLQRPDQTRSTQGAR